jgi:hypothetical protein
MTCFIALCFLFVLLFHCDFPLTLIFSSLSLLLLLASRYNLGRKVINNSLIVEENIPINLTRLGPVGLTGG